MRWRLTIVAAAALALVVPPAGSLVERVYSLTLFPVVQRALTRASNLVPFALFDLLIIVVALIALAPLVRDIRRRRRLGWGRVVTRTLSRVVVTGAAAYLAFLACWGLNYRRVPLPERTDFDASRVTAADARRLGAYAVARVNALHAAAHAEAPVPRGTIDPRLSRAFIDAQPTFASPSPFVAARPKRTLLDLYFRRAGVAGMTDPYFLETLVTSDLLDVEVPMVVAHEWGHLAGLGDEGEASFAGFLACLRGSALHQYSGWLSLYTDIVNGLSPVDARTLAEQLDAGPRADLQAIRERLLRQINRTVSAAGWRVYDQYLKANRVDEGTASYADVVRLVLGTRTVALDPNAEVTR